MGVSETEVWFEWGRTPALGEETAHQPINTSNMLESVNASITGVLPNATVYYRLAGEDENVKAPETLTSQTVSFTTPVVAPRIVGEPQAQFVKAFSAVMFAELNPENANTKYYFEYWPTSNPADKMRTATGESGVYGLIGVTSEAVSLQPGTIYSYRLVATNEAGTTLGQGGHFTTAPAPRVEAETSAAIAVTSTEAMISGSVNPDGQPATYAFELGVYEGASTQYDVVSTGSTGEGTVAERESLTLTGLQPGTTYAYRISISSGYGNAVGAPATFTTAGLPEVLMSPTPLAMLPVPSIVFPTKPTPAVKCKRGYTLNAHGKCVKTQKKKPKLKHIKKGRNK
jgi:phosphodiesterase/alkaline phosphatase D-like protein